MIDRVARFVAWMAVGAGLAAACGTPWAPEHVAQRFPIVGAHQDVPCEGCHVDDGPVPTTCEACHEDDRPAPHFAGACAACHDEYGWGGATWDHSAFPLVEGHALDCAACHTGGTLGALDDACTACHEPDRPAPHWTGECGDCHDLSGWTGGTVPHDFLPLEAAHDLACTSCHTSGTYEGLDATCASCHEADRPQPGTEHWAPQDCGGCHPATQWSDGTFEHPSLPLAGAHDLECTACHTTPGTWSGLDPSCATCHEADRPVAHFPGDCVDCHTATTWADATFDHTFFPLTGNHDRPCETCHTNGTYEGLDTACTTCHAADVPEPGHYTGQDCAACHTVATWAFNHQPLFPIPHRGVSACNDCHLGGDVSDFSCTHCHEHVQSEADDEHRDVQGYTWNSDACLRCHPDGRD